MARMIEKRKYRVIETEEKNYVIFGASVVLFGVCVCLGVMSLISNVASVKTWTNGEVAANFVDEPFLASVMNWFFPVIAACLDFAKNAIAVILGGIISAGYHWLRKTVLSVMVLVVWAVLATISIIFMVGTASGLMGARASADAQVGMVQSAAEEQMKQAKALVAKYEEPLPSVETIEAEKSAFLAIEPVNNSGTPSSKTNGQWIEQSKGCDGKLNRYSRAACPLVIEFDRRIAESSAYYEAVAVTTAIMSVSTVQKTGVEVFGEILTQMFHLKDDGSFSQQFSVGLAFVIEGLGFFGFMISTIGFSMAQYTKRTREYYTVKERAPSKPRVVHSSQPALDETEIAA